MRAESLLVLSGVLIASTFGLVPDQSRQALGAELLALGLLVWPIPLGLHVKTRWADMPRSWMVSRVIAHQCATSPLLGAAVSLLLGAGGGLYWLVPTTVFSFIGALINAWVLLKFSADAHGKGVEGAHGRCALGDIAKARSAAA